MKNFDKLRLIDLVIVIFGILALNLKYISSEIYLYFMIITQAIMFPLILKSPVREQSEIK
jgi:hypothetical protein